jgi:hypothetical protein
MIVAITQYNKKNRESIEKRISQDLNAGREGEWKKLKTTHKLQQKKKKSNNKGKDADGYQTNDSPASKEDRKLISKPL